MDRLGFRILFAIILGVVESSKDHSPFLTDEDYQLCRDTDWKGLLDQWFQEEQYQRIYPDRLEAAFFGPPGIERVLYTQAGVMWPSGIIPYEIQEGFSAQDRAGIACAMAYMEKNTCLRFKPHDTPGTEDRPKMIFVPENWGGFCQTNWRTNGHGSTLVKLHLSTDSVCTFGRTLIHEMIHGLSGAHTQNRYDRDAHVEIMWDNVLEERKNQFKICDWLCDFNKAFPYDCDSIMHYAKNQMAIDPTRPTIVAKDPSQCRLLDFHQWQVHQPYLSNIDVEMIQDIYGQFC